MCLAIYPLRPPRDHPTLASQHLPGWLVFPSSPSVFTSHASPPVFSLHRFLPRKPPGFSFLFFQRTQQHGGGRRAVAVAVHGAGSATRHQRNRCARRTPSCASVCDSLLPPSHLLFRCQPPCVLWVLSPWRREESAAAAAACGRSVAGSRCVVVCNGGTAQAITVLRPPKNYFLFPAPAMLMFRKGRCGMARGAVQH